ncbi:stage II sporulation protein P [Tissierella sp. Yu-01]|uniref:stage II sporulation protein P n=1 Tax=Tissierella sp. Yu-01 TaxID=3035694 RepID=UPI00240E443B|nr:stage II sporulation protein P [Tissierella sp. Yu-01]WFA09531.1 stage II sporulation protein P [Tissierella sp. Yu-01]
MRRRKVRRIKKTDSYLVMILVCLLILNFGVLLYRVVLTNAAIDSKSMLVKVFSNLKLNELDFWLTDDDEVAKNNNEFEDSTIDDSGELEYIDDYIIDRLDEYESLIIIKESNGISSIENIPKPLNIEKVKVDREKDYILMYHTHATEAYLTDDEDLYHNPDTSKNMISIGEVMTKVLEAKGHKVDHVQTLHDLPSYNKSYTRSINTINSKKTENNNLKIFFDLHRDGVDKDAEYKDRFLETARININGVSTATFSLVVGPDADNYEQILNFAKYIKAVSDTLYPNLCTGIIVKPYGKYNLNVSNYSALVEVGSNLVTQEEATETAKLVGEILSLVIDSIIE